MSRAAILNGCDQHSDTSGRLNYVEIGLDRRFRHSSFSNEPLAGNTMSPDKDSEYTIEIHSSGCFIIVEKRRDGPAEVLIGSFASREAAQQWIEKGCAPRSGVGD